MSRRLSSGSVLLLILLQAACVQAPDDSREADIRRQLTGTWLREYRQGEVQVRRILVLEAAGRFTEDVLARPPEGNEVRNSHAGEWHFDGTNLKRRYTLIDGRKPSAPTFPYAAFQLSLESRNAFVGTDNIRQREVRYHRVSDGTRP